MYGYLGRDIMQAIAWMKAHPEEVHAYSSRCNERLIAMNVQPIQWDEFPVIAWAAMTGVPIEATVAAMVHCRSFAGQRMVSEMTEVEFSNNHHVWDDMDD